MKFKRNYIVYLFIGILFFILAGVVFYDYSDSPSNISVNTKKIEKIVAQKQHDLDTLTHKLKASISDSQCSALFNDAEFKDNLNEKGLSIIIYKDNQLVYWSDNFLMYPVYYNPDYFDHPVISFNNTYVIGSVLDQGNYHIIGLALIKTNYSYENDLVKNKFDKDFNLDNSFEVSLIPSSEGFAITGVHNNFLFSLIPDYQNNSLGFLKWFSFFSYLIAFIIILTLLYSLTVNLYIRYPSLIWLIAVLLDLIIIRYLMIKLSFPDVFKSLDLFKPQFYASSKWIPSFGDFILNALCFLLFSLVFVKLFHLNIRKARWKIIIRILCILFLTGVFTIIVYFLKDLIANSNIPLEFYNILSINTLSIILVVVSGMLLMSFILISNRIINELFKNLKWSSFLLFLFIPILFFISYLYIVKQWIDIYSAIMFIVLILILFFINKRKSKFDFSFLALLIFLISLYTILFINHYDTLKEKEIRKVLAVNLSNEHDFIGELQLADFEDKLKKDKTIIELLKAPEKNADALNKHINNKYFHGYWGKYDVKVTTCKEKDSLEVQENDSLKYCNCIEYFGDVFFDYGYTVPKTNNFSFIENNDGRIRYLGRISYMMPEDSSMINLYLDMTSKLISTELGYPELLLKSKLKKSRLESYSYAKYKKGLLISQSGDFSYNYNSAAFNQSMSEFSFLTYDDYDHLVYNTGEQKIIISKPVVRKIDVVISFTYVFTILFIILILYFIIKNFPYQRLEFNIKHKIQFVMISLLLFSLIVIGGGSIYYNLKQYKKNQIKNISEKTQSVLIELEHKVGDYKYSDFVNMTLNDPDYMNYLLVKFSNVFYSDINLYYPNGDLQASSRMEIFNEGLVNRKMNPDAYYHLHNKRSTKYIHDETIGSLNYISSYVPFRNKYNELLGYINLPYFTKQTVLRAELSTLIVAIINSYLLLFIFTAFLAVLIANNVTRPLRLVQRKFKDIQLGKKNEPIDYKKQDEIGELIQEYNRMVIELEKSAMLLAKSERESAWREMAKQIAHEIKNPLTPMKLSVQHLSRSWEKKDKNYPELQKKVTTTLIEQIDTLSTIASEFSMFAKLPKTKYVALDIVEKIENTARLFDDVEHVNINIEKPDEPLFIMADKDEMMRVFNNLIQNGIQAISNKEGKIDINIKKTKSEVIISVKDNGSGIKDELKDKLFQPNFTTKSSGMGLGLAIVQSIVEESGGDIWFETEINEGTTFYIRLPLMKEPQADPSESEH